jgi:tRNA(Ile)-lysidine synthase
MGSSRNRPIDDLAAVLAAVLDRTPSTDRHIVVALSGGVDSVVLLHALLDAAPARGLSVGALHVHHGLSKNADAWELHCRRLCVDWKVPLAVERVQVERGSRDGLEAAARRARHRVFASTAGDWIALAHHRDDQAETLLFNLLRGTGLRGAAAMGETSGRLLRPFLDVGRSSIEAYARQYRLPWVEDESNADTRFSRNHLRHAVLVDLEARFPGSTANLAAATRRFGEAEELLDALALIDLGSRAAGFPLDVAVLTSVSEQRARNVLRYLLKQRHIGIPAEGRLCELIRQFTTARPDRHPAALFGEWRLRRRRGKIVVERVQEP